MALITKLKVQRNQKRVNLFLDNKFAFSLSLAQLIKLNLKVGLALTPAKTDKILLQSYYETFYSKALRFLSLRPRSEKEIKDYLQAKLFKVKEISSKTKDNIIPRIIGKLKSKNYLNDQEFSSWWVGQRLTFRPKGLKVLRQELRVKGIEQETINQVLASVEREQLEKAASLIAQKKLKIYQHLSKFRLRKRLAEHLLRRGFSWQISQKVIDEIAKI